MTIPKATDGALYDGIKGPSLRQATVRVSQQIINGTSGLNLMKPWPKDRDGSLSGGIKGPNPWQTTAKANRRKSKGLKIKRDDMPVTLKVLHCTLLFKGRTSYNNETCAPMCIYIFQPICIVLLSRRIVPLLVQNEFC